MSNRLAVRWHRYPWTICWWVSDRFRAGVGWDTRGLLTQRAQAGNWVVTLDITLDTCWWFSTSIYPYIHPSNHFLLPLALDPQTFWVAGKLSQLQWVKAAYICQFLMGLFWHFLEIVGIIHSRYCVGGKRTVSFIYIYFLLFRCAFIYQYPPTPGFDWSLNCSTNTHLWLTKRRKDWLCDICFE